MIKAVNITKSFEGRTILNDISVEFGSGQTNLIIGRSGSGKTVLLKSLVGLHDVDTGAIYYDDVCFSKLDFRARKAIR
ncbi:MAG: ATP-binding cassette domain-containing protein, partial [Alistipes sp.]|nr:ATP-binding cassette domain-containing protein [Alistipes sp.]